jgi:redox-sensitive bicupin YhaK (pirin superfamily)
VKVRAIAGRSHGIDGAMQREVTEPLYLDLEIPAVRALRRRCRRRTTRSSMCIAALCEIGDTDVPVQRMAILANDARSDGVVLKATAATRALLIAGKPLGEPIAQVRTVRHEHQ